jgi:hypothetical protein
MTHPTIAQALAPFRPLTYADYYYVDLGFRHELGKADDHEYKRAYDEGPEARRLMNRGAMEAMSVWSY